jgi:hypothetical protein
MNRSTFLSAASLVLITAVPGVWLACGASNKPPESPAGETTMADGGEAAMADAASAGPESTSAPAESASAAPETSAASAPAPTPLSESDCGKCIDKTCAKSAAACEKNTDCDSTLDSIHSCAADKGALACVTGATPPTAAKPKKLANSYVTCAKKAVAKACKAKCQ